MTAGITLFSFSRYLGLVEVEGFFNGPLVLLKSYLLPPASDKRFHLHAFRVLSFTGVIPYLIQLFIRFFTTNLKLRIF